VSRSSSPRRFDKADYTGPVRFRVVLEYDAVAESWSAVYPELPGCVSAGETEAEARQSIRDAIRLYLAPSEIELPEDAKLVEVTVG
jgi:predicted RNase H-like HicB family nuclease